MIMDHAAAANDQFANPLHLTPKAAGHPSAPGSR